MLPKLSRCSKEKFRHSGEQPKISKRAERGQQTSKHKRAKVPKRHDTHPPKASHPNQSPPEEYNSEAISVQSTKSQVQQARPQKLSNPMSNSEAEQIKETIHD